MLVPHRAIAGSLCILLAALAASAPAKVTLDPSRVAEIAAMLPEKPQGVGRPIGDREAWQALADAPQFRNVVAEAERLLDAPLPEMTDDIYLDFSRTGNRTRGQKVIGARHGRFAQLALAECLENRGRFLPAIEAAIRAVCAEKSWLLPAHDRKLENYEGKAVEVDLNASATAWNLATAWYWLGDRLNPEVRDLMARELQRRTLAPMRRYWETGQPAGMWWAAGTNNWNAVCLAGVTGTALAVETDRTERARFVAAAEHYIKNFLAGFTPDGYCSEGIGYWNYGFGHFVLLAETLFQATGGKIDMMGYPAVAEIAKFGPRMEIVPGVFPAFADCSPKAAPETTLIAYLSRRFGWGMKDVEQRGLLLAAGPTTQLSAIGLLRFPNSAMRTAEAGTLSLETGPRSYFETAGILIARPLAGNAQGMGAALKGGHNAEHHNHNDLGSYVVALGGRVVLLDPGAEVYTARTFSAKRYQSKVLNSYGHPVPVVAGQLQREGRKSEAKVLRAEFTDAADTWALDIASAYAVPDLQELEREFVFTRQGAGSLTVTDTVRFASPQTFETALITTEPFQETAPGRFRIGEGSSAVEVQIDAGGLPFAVAAEKIEEDLHGPQPTRLGVRLNEPVRAARIVMRIQPAEK